MHEHGPFIGCNLTVIYVICGDICCGIIMYNYIYNGKNGRKGDKRVKRDIMRIS